MNFHMNSDTIKSIFASRADKRAAYGPLLCVLLLLILIPACSGRVQDVMELQQAESGVNEETFGKAVQDSAGAESGAGGLTGADDKTAAAAAPATRTDTDVGGTPADRTLFVHICGSVSHPGVYELPAGSRVFEAVEAAGGFTEQACEDYVNQALPLTDGIKITIPTIEQVIEAAEQGDDEVSSDVSPGLSYGLSSDNPSVSSSAGGYGIGEQASGEGGGPSGLVNINTASAAELCSLTGIGANRAEAIIAYREKNGGFSSIEDIMKVEGIKDGMFAKLRDSITVR